MPYGATVLADAPIHYWRLADPGGGWFHDIGSTRRALMQGAGGIAASSPYTGPCSDGGAVWNGLGGALNYTDADLLATQPISLECWFWLHHNNGAAVDFLAVGDGATTIALGLSGTLQAHAFSSGGAITAAAATTRQAWHHLVLTDKPAACNLYLDAINVGTIVGAGVGVWHPGMLVGAGGNPSAPTRFANAAIAEAAVYAAELTPAQVTAHFLAADTTGARPVFRTNGTFDSTTGGTVTVGELASDVRRAVYRTYT